MLERFLADENFPASVVRFLRARGHDVVFVVESHSGVTDAEVMTLAHEQDRLILTFDLDFGELLFKNTSSSVPGIVLFRLPDTLGRFERIALLEGFFVQMPELRGLFTVVKPGQIRQIPIRSLKPA